MKSGFRFLLGALAAMAFGSAAPATTYNAAVSGTSQQQIKGWGCLAARQDLHSGRYFLNHPLAVQATLVDLGLTVDRVCVTYNHGDVSGNLTSDFDDIIDLVDELDAVDLPYIISIWTPPTGMKTVNTTAGNDGATPPNPVYLQAAKYGAFCTWVVNQMAAIAAEGLPLPVAVSIQNEPTVTNSSSGCIYTPAQYQTVLKQLRTALDTAGYSSVHLLAPEDGGYANTATGDNCPYFFGGSGFPTLASDSAFNAAVWGFAAHSYKFPFSPTYEDQWTAGCDADTLKRDRWMTEYSYCDGTQRATGDDLTDHMNTAIGAIRHMASDLVYMKNNWWFWWVGWQYDTPISSGQSLTEGDGTTTLTKSNLYWVLRKLFHDAPPGSFVQQVPSTDPGFVSAPTSYVYSMDTLAFKNGTRNVVVLVNPDTAAHATNVSGLTGAVAEVHQTVDGVSGDADQDLRWVSTPAIVSGAVSGISLPARSITVIRTNEKNLVANPGFEAGMTGGWWVAYGGTGAVVSTPVADGRQASSVWGSAGVRQIVSTGWAVGDTLTLSGTGCLSAAEPTGGAVIGAYCVDASGTTISAFRLNYNSELSYTRKSVTFTVPAGTAAIWVQSCNGGGSATFYADDIALVQANLLTNSGFEGGISPWYAWSTGTGTIGPVSSPVHSGTGAVAVTGTRGMQQYPSDFYIGETLTLSAWGRVSAAESGGGGYVGLYCKNNAGGTISQIGLSWISEAAYTQKSATIAVPPGTVSVQVIVDNNGGASTFYADDVTVLH